MCPGVSILRNIGTLIQARRLVLLLAPANECYAALTSIPQKGTYLALRFTVLLTISTEAAAGQDQSEAIEYNRKHCRMQLSI